MLRPSWQDKRFLCNNFNIFPFSKQKNFLLVGTADGNLVIFEDKTVKVNVECILRQNYFVLSFMYAHSYSLLNDYKLP